MLKYPGTIYIFGNPLLLHGILEGIGIFVAFRLYLWQKRKQGDTLEQYNRLVVLTAATLGALTGSHVIGALEDVPKWMASPGFWSYLYGNKTLVGGLVGGLTFVEVAKKLIGEQQNSGDLYTFPLLLGMIVGRIGCFSAGIYEETYGLPSHLPLAMDLGDGILRHPVTLYEIFFLVALWIGLAYIKKRYPLTQGGLFKVFLICYLIFRFLLDFIKPGWRYFMGLGTIQLTCLAGLFYYYRYIINPKLIFKNYAG
ncbi:MAG: prolipoprotein diacylglyceryl transferase [Taibaiella sp.]|nr:prolipoprotein diacylglyceryl transferase [Taibaiella sp.]